MHTSIGPSQFFSLSLHQQGSREMSSAFLSILSASEKPNTFCLPFTDIDTGIVIGL